jgi:hypothetical protein
VTDYIDNRGRFRSEIPIGEGGSIEAQAVERYFRSKRVEDLTLAALKQEYPHDPAACLVFMTDAAFAYFLPGFMRIALDDYSDAGSIPEAVIGRLLAMAEGRDNQRRDFLLGSYSAAQLAAVATFLKNMSARYWHKYPEDSALLAYHYWAAVAAARVGS